MIQIQKNLDEIQKKIREYEIRYHRKAHSVFLLAVSKTQSLEKMREAIAAGQRAFGENYLQESLKKQAALVDEKLEWHFIGSIQSNKIKKIAEHFSWVQSISDKRIAQRLNDARPLHLPPLNICIEVNVSAEPAKTGASRDVVAALAEFCSTLPRIVLRGLMAIPADKHSFQEQRMEFHKLREIYDHLQPRYKFDTLSMGMSHDMEAAIAEGATMVRIGTAIFGDR